MRRNDPIPSEAKLDPRIKDVIIFNRVRDLVDKEILHQAWGCRLWTLERQDKITREQRKAGDAFCYLVEEYKNAFYGKDPEPAEELRHKRVRRRYKEARDVLRHGDSKVLVAVEELCLEELAPVTERQLRLVRNGLTLLIAFFDIENKS
jgi:hypothetical protein